MSVPDVGRAQRAGQNRMRTGAASRESVQTPATDARPSGALDAVDGYHGHDEREMTRSERIGFWMYVAMASFCAAVVIAAALSALVS
jgi:hypothetical protein